MDQAAEMQLIEAARRGSVSAFEQLVFEHQERLYRFLLARADNRADAEDALQEAFAAAFRYLPAYRERYRFSTWLFTIALRQLVRLGRQRPAGQSGLPDMLSSGQAGPEQLGMQTQARQSLWRTARDCLSEAQFDALWLFYVEDLSLKEVAAVMKRPVSWVKVNLLRARRRLSRELRDEHFEPVAGRKEVTL